ncbi:MAG: BCCT family transporter [Dehalococcoidia bacterium]|nr:BCCT family transporter [Dehalococcoidia bacterium]
MVCRCRCGRRFTRSSAKRIHGWPGNLVDVLAVLGTMFGVATSLGLGVMQINAGLGRVFDVSVATNIQVWLIAGITIIATVSVFTGVDTGIEPWRPSWRDCSWPSSPPWDQP